MADELKKLKEQFDQDLKHFKNRRDTALDKTGETIATDKTKFNLKVYGSFIRLAFIIFFSNLCLLSV